MKKNLILFLTLFLGLKTMAAVEPTVSLSDLKMKPGTEMVVSMELQNAEYNITSLQGDFILPEGVTVSDISLKSDRFKTKDDAVSHVLNANAKRFLVTANRAYGSVAAVEGTSGAVITFKVNVAKNVAYGTYPIEIANVELGDAEFKSHYAGCKATLTVYEEFTVAAATDAQMGTVTGAGTYEYGDEATLTATAKEGYHFVSWTSDGTIVSVSNTYKFTVNANATLTANFAPNKYTMTFVLENGEDNVVITKDFGTELTAPIELVKTGYNFSGWTPVVPEAIPAKDMTFTAQWTVNQYTMTFVLNNGEENIVIMDDYGTALEAPAPTKKGYSFAGWDVVVPSTIPAEDKTINATWTINNYTITYDLDGGKLAKDEKNPATYTVESGDITLKNPTREGYVFAGWKGTDIDDTSMEVIIAKGSIGDRTYTATWTEASSIKALFRDSKAVNVYTVGGTLVGRDMTVGEVLQLKRGIYVINGKKIVVK